MTVLEAASLFMAFLGTGLSLFLGVVFFPQRRIAPAGPATWRLMLTSGIWHLASFVLLLYPAAFRRAAPYESILQTAAWIALAIYFFQIAMLGLAAGRNRQPYYLLAVGVSTIFAVLPLPLPLLTSGPPFLIACFYFIRNTFGLAISRRYVFALTLGVSAAVYLAVVRLLANILETRFGAVGWLIELGLLLCAGILWLPLYAAISRFLTRRTELYAAFGRAVIHDAALIFDIEKRKQFLAREIATRFRLSQALLLNPNDAPELCDYASAYTGDMFHLLHMEPCPARDVLLHLHCNYFFPLRYENRLTGFLLIDSSPSASLDENEPVLLALAPQVSQSLESCRLLEEKIALERELVRQEHLASLGKVSATIAHEIKNPLSAIKTIAQLMREDEAVTASYSEDLEFIVSEVNRLDQSVRQLLGFSRPPSILDEDVSLSELVESIAAALSRQAQPLGIQMHTRILPGIVLRHSNRELVQQIVMNLLLNAMQASPANTAIQIDVDATPQLTIQDQGPGIPPELRERIFEPFFTTRQKGTGLGLAIVRKNARLLGGDVTLANAPEGGTTATVTFGNT
jgi:signal transduction histidine kinase